MSLAKATLAGDYRIAHRRCRDELLVDGLAHTEDSLTPRLSWGHSRSTSATQCCCASMDRPLISPRKSRPCDSDPSLSHGLLFGAVSASSSRTLFFPTNHSSGFISSKT